MCTMGVVALLQLYVANIFWVVIMIYSIWKGRDRPIEVKIWQYGIYLGIFFWLFLNLMLRFSPNEAAATFILRLATVGLVVFLFSIIKYNIPFVELKRQVSPSYFLTDFFSGILLALILFTDHIQTYYRDGMWYDQISPVIYLTVLAFGAWSAYWMLAGFYSMQSSTKNKDTTPRSFLYRITGVIILVLVGFLIFFASLRQFDKVGDTSAYFTFSIALGIFLTYNYSIKPMQSVIANQKVYEVIVSDYLGTPIFRARLKDHLKAPSAIISAGTHIVWTTIEAFSNFPFFVKNLDIMLENRVLLSSKVEKFSLILITEKHNLQSELLFRMLEKKLVEIVAHRDETHATIRVEFERFVSQVVGV